MTSAEQLTVRVKGALMRVLPESVRLAVTAADRSRVAPRFDVTVWSGATKHQFTVGWAGEGWPADVERLANLVPDVDVVAAANLSDGARGWLTQKDLGWVDEDGRADIRRPSGLVIFREPAGVRTPREHPNRWTRSMLTVAEAGLSGVEPTVESIERATGLSRNATTSALDRLERLGLLYRPGARRGPMSGRRIVDTNAFLDAYAAAAAELRAKQSLVLLHRTWADPVETLRLEIAPALNAGAEQWAVTGAGASILLAPYLSDVTTLELYVGSELLGAWSRLEALLGGRVVERGQRIEVRELPTAMTSEGPVIDGIHVALPVRVYADLNAAGGRSAEAAHHLRETLDVGAAA
jgi:Transcriptional regulator, AbiEi antitoxin, Type IV TA system